MKHLKLERRKRVGYSVFSTKNNRQIAFGKTKEEALVNAIIAVHNEQEYWANCLRELNEEYTEEQQTCDDLMEFFHEK